jgi:hypothetical protein
MKRVLNRLREYSGSEVSSAWPAGLARGFEEPVRLYEVRWQQ